MLKKFQRAKEDFTCLNCGLVVTGNGYTNHCPACLWSQHVDHNPGDRLHGCQGMMKPIGLELNGGDYSLIHQCLQCGVKKKNKVTKKDDFKVVLQLAREQTDLTVKHG